MERLSDLCRNGKLSSQKALKVISQECTAIEESYSKLQADRAHEVLKAVADEFVKLAGGELQSFTVRDWLTSWIKGRTDASKATVTEYQHGIYLFLKFLGARADLALTTLQPSQIEKFKERQAERVAPSTVNKALKVLKASLGNAVARQQLEFNPAEHVPFIEQDSVGRRKFRDDEITKLLNAACPEWRTMILLGYYTGQRLRDCANLTWEQIDLVGNEISLTTEKTDRDQSIPIAEPLARHLATLAGDVPAAPLCPGLHGKKASWLSAQFYKVMVTAELVPKRDHQGKGKGRDAKRETNRISFHSLRYNTTSALKSAGVNDSVTMDIVGHETAAVSRNYTKIDIEAKRAAMNKLPDITK